MNKVIIILCLLVLGSGESLATGNIDTMFKIGANWQVFDTSFAQGHLKSTMTGLGFNIFHGFYREGDYYARDRAPNWIASEGGAPTKLIVDDKGAIRRYSGGGDFEGGGAQFVKQVNRTKSVSC